MPVIKLGNARNRENDIKLSDDTVSGSHLEMEWVDDDTLVITDMGTTNHTIVNGDEIRKKVIHDDDVIQIGRNTFTGKQLKEKTLPFKYRDRVTFYDEFEALEVHFETYKKKIRKLKSSHKSKVTYLRIGIPIFLLVLFMVFGEQLSLGPSDRIIVTVVGSSIAVLFAEKLFSPEKLKEDIIDLREEYKKILKCPKCQQDLSGKSYPVWTKQRMCHKPVCQANWVE